MRAVGKVAGLINHLVKFIVQLHNLLPVLFLCVEFRQINNFFQLLQPLPGDMHARPARTETLQVRPATNEQFADYLMETIRGL